MSSHHIVREKQEPALLIMSLDNFDHEYLGQLLEWSPWVIVSDKVYEKADSTGIKIDGVLTSDAAFITQSDTQVINTGGDQLEDGLKFLIAEGFNAVNIITDQFHTKDFALFIDFINLVIYHDNKKVFPVKPGFSKWKQAGERVELLQEAAGLKTANLTPVEGLAFETEKDGFYTLLFEQPFVFIAEDI